MRTDELRQLAEAEESYWWHRGRQRIVRRVLTRYVAPNSRILDVGCGPGGTTKSYSGANHVLGVDASDESTRLARGRGLEVALMDATHLATRAQSWDAIVALDLIEHVDDDVAALREMREALRPGGTLVATVPAYQFLWSSHDEAVGHRRRYTKGQLERVAREAGFEVVLGAYVMSSILAARDGRPPGRARASPPRRASRDVYARASAGEHGPRARGGARSGAATARPDAVRPQHRARRAP